MKRSADLAAFLAATTDLERNSIAFEALSHDKTRQKFYADINSRQGGRLTIPSRDKPNRSLSVASHSILLVTNAADIAHIFANPHSAFSNAPYRKLGDGAFMLGLDPFATSGAPMYTAQKTALSAALRKATQGGALSTLCDHAIKEAEVMALADSDFDLARFAWETALRFCSVLYGYPLTSYPVLHKCVPAAYAGLTYQILGRHFVTGPQYLPQAETALGGLLIETADLIDRYARDPGRRPEGVRKLPAAPGFEPAMMALAAAPGGLTSSELALVVVGAIVGTVGNIQAAVCTAVRHLVEKFNGAPPSRPAHKQPLATLRAEIANALTENPPAAFLPRESRNVDPDLNIAAGQSIVLALGGASSARAGNSALADDLVFGAGVSRGGAAGGMHACLGRFVAQPLVDALVLRVIGLPGLAQALDPVNGKVAGIHKTWGFRCDSYPMKYRRSAVRKQTTLNVAIPIKPPISQNAVILRELICAAAPRINDALRRARHVHFAWFEVVENDTKLVLHTVYDGDFDAYIQYFALRVGELFDILFDYLAVAPPRPVRKFPAEFIALVALYNRPPASDYFFSAYQNVEVPMIQQAFR